MDFFFFQLAIIFIPGLVWERVASKYGLRRTPTQFEIALRTFTFGLTAYFATFVLYVAFGFEFLIPELRATSTFLEKKYINEYVAALIVASIGSVIWLYAVKYKILSTALQKLGATRTYGEEDIWEFALNTSDAWSEYVHVRDYEKDKIFCGWVAAYSESDQVRELLLRDVEVYALNEPTLLYGVPFMYIGRPADAIDVEFPARASEQMEMAR